MIFNDNGFGTCLPAKEGDITESQKWEQGPACKSANLRNMGASMLQPNKVPYMLSYLTCYHIHLRNSFLKPFRIFPKIVLNTTLQQSSQSDTLFGNSFAHDSTLSYIIEIIPR